MRKIDPEFFDTVNYAICSAATTMFGAEVAKELFKRMGEIIYNELKKRGVITFSREPMDTLTMIAKYLEKAGYMQKITITLKGKNRAIAKMQGVSVLRSSIKLTNEGKTPSHIMTNTMFAALEEYKLKAKLIDLGFNEKRNIVREKWILRKK